jgi:hypothetical protein
MLKIIRSKKVGVFPSRLKYSEKIPLFENAERANMTNYRPISLLISFPKFVGRLYISDCTNI